MKSINLKIIAFWFALLGLALINATIRETTYKPLLEPHIGFWAHQLSSLTGMGLFFGAIYFFIKKSRYKYSKRELLVMGSVWTAMTIAFEIFMNIFIRHLSLAEVLATYYFWRGETWIFVLLSILWAPLLVGRIIYPQKAGVRGN
ncbi:MAG: hypothetical protein V3574_05780 [Candidatus Moraniibacteriota bacterium]